MRIRSITADSRMAATILSCPPQFGQCSRSIWNTSLSNRAQLMHAGWRCVQVGSAAVCSDTLACPSGLVGTSAANRFMNSSGEITKCAVPSRQGVFSPEYHLPGVVDLNTLINQRQEHDVAAQVLEGLAVIASAPPRAGTNPARGRA